MTIVCPECKSRLYDDAEVCWKCGHSLTAEAAGPALRPWMIVAAVAALAAIVILWVL